MSLPRMDYRKVDDQWVCKVLGQELTAVGDTDDDEEEEEKDEGDAPHSPPLAIPSTSEVPTLATPSTARPIAQPGSPWTPPPMSTRSTK